MKSVTTRVRRWLLVLLTLGILGVFTWRLMNIQIVESDTWRQMRDGGYTSFQTVKATRGEIVDRNGLPLAVNRMGYDVILDKAYLPAEGQNDIILSLIDLLERLGETWTDSLPVTTQYPFRFKEGLDTEVQRVRDLLKLQVYATAEDVMYQLVDRYGLEDYSPLEQRKIASVRYEMERRDFTWNVPYTFATDIDISSVIQIKERGYYLEGVDVVESAVRTYPNGHLAPHVIGNVGPIYAEEWQSDNLADQGYAMDDRLGKSGVEKAFESILRGQNGQRQIYIGGGRAIEALETEAPVAGNTVMLTLDLALQQVAQDSLEQQIKYLQQNAPAGEGREANAGAVVALNAKTGEVLALATYPSYDLNSYSRDYERLAADTEGLPLLNRAVLGGYAPGSTFKPVVGTAGLTYGAIEAGSTVFCGRAYIVAGHPFTCLSYHGNYNVVQALTRSCNIFFYDVGKRVGIDRFAHIAGQYGLGEPTGIEIPERIGQVSTPDVKMRLYNESWQEGDTVQSAIGQLYNEFTPLQLANYAATIANRGRRMRVTLIHEVRDYTMNNVTQPFEAKVEGRVDADGEVFDTIIRGMVAASGAEGTAARYFAGYPVTVASKTGTPETNDLPNSTFICFAPAEDPQIAIAVVIEQGWHGYTGAPVAKELFNHWFGFDLPDTATPPKKEEETEAAEDNLSESSEASQMGDIPETLTETVDDAQQSL